MLRTAHRVALQLELIKDALKEAYHVAFLHKRSLRDSFTGGRNPFSHALDFKLFPIHHRGR